MKFVEHIYKWVIANLNSTIFGIGDLAKRMVETKKDKLYPLVYLLVTLALVLLLCTTIVARTFSTMKFVKNKLRNRMRDE
ncbi:hypothetical protein CISIN_1g048231mg [Citrus sinensis]|uniref:Uncharacterized protein n=1 Tax=Citrus sinensis TaxID=2711 RepID=A0A067DJX6_CITSI|nr:hypothetical protein CISIN_1g048231mg [Citrus sinensis]